jgi:hypothetical protein
VASPRIASSSAAADTRSRSRSAAPIHDEDGSVTGAVMVFRDVGAALKRPSRCPISPARHADRPAESVASE